jgi:homoserine dehydrogenase
MKMRVGIAGFGTVGQGAARILVEHREEISRKAGAAIEITAVCSRGIARQDTSFLPAGVRRETDWRAVASATDVDVVCELIGGTSVADEVVRAAMAAGKTVVTANKNLLAARGTELERLARAAGVGLHCEASVAGGIPVLAALREGIAGDRVLALYGILNGTSNFILTTMEATGRGMADVLAEAQKLGYAEADPSADVEGWDARFKLAILARMAFGCEAPVEAIPCQGITRVDGIDFRYADRLGGTIRLIGAARRNDEGSLSLAVRPLMISRQHMLAKVQGAYNAVWVQGAQGGDTLYYGRGAGGGPTGVAVVSDIIRAARDLRSGARNRAPSFGYETPNGAAQLDPEGPPTRHYLRFVVDDRPGIIEKLAGALATHHINIDSVIQEPHADKRHLPFVITLEHAPAGRVAAALAEMASQPFLCEPPLHMAMDDF